MTCFYIILAVLAAFILIFMFWCLIEPFILDLDKAILENNVNDKTAECDINIQSRPLISGNTSGNPDLRLFFFSDIHIEWCPVTASRLCKAIRKSHGKAPLDAVVFGGDITSRPRGAKRGYKYLQTVSACCKELGIPFYGVSGNHDSCLTNPAESSGFISLDNKSVSLLSSSSGKEITLAGLPDSGRKNRVWLKALPCNNVTPLVLVVHDPEALIHLDSSSRPDYMLSGHIHGGQMKLPFDLQFTALRKADKLPRMGAVQGVYTIYNSTVFISRGLGCGVLPVRFLSAPEATVVEIYI